MSGLLPALGRIVRNPQFNPNFGCLNTCQQVRFSKRKRPAERLKKPEDKSQVILGKVPAVKEKFIHGVSDKQHPILMQWKKPQRMETCNPPISGDMSGLEHFGEVDLSQPPVSLQGSKVLESAEDEVKRVLSLEFARRRDMIGVLRQRVVKGIQRHKLDLESKEVKIAIETVKIRNLHHELVQLWPYKNQPVKVKLTNGINTRRLLLESLRQEDYKKYEWILEKLNLFYKPLPNYDYMEISRKASIERLTDIWCDELKNHRLTKYKRELEDEQPKFLRNKAAKLQHIMSEEKDLGLEPTVTQADIDECIRRAEEIEKKNLSREEEIQHLVYKEEIAPEQTFIN